jgi:hypothetical protein
MLGFNVCEESLLALFLELFSMLFLMLPFNFQAIGRFSRRAM